MQWNCYAHSKFSRKQRDSRTAGGNQVDKQTVRLNPVNGSSMDGFEREFISQKEK